MYYVKCGPKKSNMGDLVGPYLYAARNGGKFPIQKDPSSTPESVLLTCGSILQPQLVLPNSVIWGSGIITTRVAFAKKPKSVLAVRGPITRAALLRHGIQCPEVYGDPALLLPRFYMPRDLTKKYKVGLIPHYVDYEIFKLLFSNIDGVHVIEMDQSVEGVCDEIVKCEQTLSSSLHGIIVSHAYGVPGGWMDTKNKLWGDNVKYFDYFASVGHTDKIKLKPVHWETLKGKDCQQLSSLIASVPNSPVKMPDLEKLIEACPF